MSTTGRELHVLHIDVSEDDAFLARRALERGGLRVKFKRVETLPEFESELEAGRWDVVLSDFEAKGFGASDALRTLDAYKKTRVSSDIPFIVLAGSIGEDSTANLMRRGAHDYINKNKLSHLALAVEREITAARIRYHDASNAHDQFGTPRLYDAVFEIAPDPILILDDSGVIIEMNSAALNLFDPGHDSGLGKNIAELNAWRSKVHVENALQQHRSGLRVCNAEILVTDQDHHEHLLLWSISEVELSSVARILWFGRDITQTREQDQSLVRQHKMQALQTLGTGLAHDLKTTFSDILRYTEKATLRGSHQNVQRNEQDEVLSRYHHGIQSAALAGRNLVHRIETALHASHAERPHPTVLLHHLIQGTLLEFERQMPENICIRSRIHGNHIVAAHPASFCEMLTHILANATTAMGDDGGEILLHVEDVPKPPLSSHPRRVKLSVSDTGHGIAPEHLERVTDPYFSTKSPETSDEREEQDEAGAPGVFRHGVGLGLSVVQQLLTEMGGELTISSQPGQGCTVALFLLATEPPELSTA